MRIISTQRDATAAVLAENQFNDPPAAGNQFFLATVNMTYVSGTKAGDPGFVAGFNLRTVGPSNVIYTTFGNSCGWVFDRVHDARRHTVLDGFALVESRCLKGAAD